MPDKKLPAHWMGRPIVDVDHVHNLETAAALNEFGKGMSRHDAEVSAHDDYVKQQRLNAAAHHLLGIKAMQGAGDMDKARRHGLMFELHMRAMGLDPAKPVPPEIQSKLSHVDKRWAFKPHEADMFAVNQTHEAAPLEKSEGPNHCQWDPTPSTKSQCKNPQTRRVAGKAYCHHHADLAAKVAHSRYRSSDRPQHDTGDLKKSDKPDSLSWVGRDGMSIPKQGSPDRQKWDRSFVKDLLSKLGVKHQPKIVQVMAHQIIPRNPPVNGSRVDMYTEMAKAGEKLPPIAVERTGYGWYAVDGNHRTEAWQRAGRHKEPIEALDITKPNSPHFEKE